LRLVHQLEVLAQRLGLRMKSKIYGLQSFLAATMIETSVPGNKSRSNLQVEQAFAYRILAWSRLVDGRIELS
jgi:hypothetical protein